MSRKQGRIARNEISASVKQAIALEQQRIDSIPHEQIDEVGGGFVLPGTQDPGTMGMYPPEPKDPGLPSIPGL